MKHIGQELFKIIERKGLVKRQIALAVGIDPSRFSSLKHSNDLRCEELENICKQVGISPGYFFDDWPGDGLTIRDITNSSVNGDATVNISKNDMENFKHIIETQRELIAEKERFIKYLLRDKTEEANIDESETANV